MRVSWSLRVLLSVAFVTCASSYSSYQTTGNPRRAIDDDDEKLSLLEEVLKKIIDDSHDVDDFQDDKENDDDGQSPADHLAAESNDQANSGTECHRQCEPIQDCIIMECGNATMAEADPPVSHLCYAQPMVRFASVERIKTASKCVAAGKYTMCPGGSCFEVKGCYGTFHVKVFKIECKTVCT
ncbi:uncharacterized protein LOC106168129 [Lingula anatina]|uniref:Uncharacterized protein LOC106168129 n=1 Tax=Lingula anatina TaxID=7574 RepID=A0A1S3IWG0_LINAN|nr:uncharacterized protein LOC106168129 [Lingula anatina]|eukprot:XP_013402525.1 uncharacterized protein LOC106168129 [Lingula anatina]